jgi:invasion protein IalB
MIALIILVTLAPLALAQNEIHGTITAVDTNRGYFQMKKSDGSQATMQADKNLLKSFKAGDKVTVVMSGSRVITIKK